MTKLKLIAFIGLFVGGILVGGLVVAWRFNHVMGQRTVSEAPKVAFRAAEEANWLALLRLNETNNLTKELEISIDANALALARWSESKQPDEQTRKLRDRFLVSVKVYHDIYPPTGEGADEIKAFLATVPRKDPKKVCASGVCKLVEQHREIQNTYNLPP